MATMTPQIFPVTSSTAVNVAICNATGTAQLANGGGHIAAPPLVQSAGSADAICTLYDGTSTSGTPLATFSLASGGPAMMPNSGFSTGLFVSVTGTTAGTLQITYTGNAASV